MDLFNMFLWRKKIDVIKYWKKKVDYLFSKDWMKFADFWKEQSKLNLDNINIELYHSHYRAASLQPIGVVISRKNVSFERRFKLATLEKEYLK